MESSRILNNSSNLTLILNPSFQSEDFKLTSWEIQKHHDFSVKRVYFISMGKGEIRGNHAHKALKQLFVVLSGEIKLDLNFQSKLQPISVVLKENQGVILEPMTWRVFECLSESARIFVAANEEFDEMDYVRNLDVFNGKQI